MEPTDLMQDAFDSFSKPCRSFFIFDTVHGPHSEEEKLKHRLFMAYVQTCSIAKLELQTLDMRSIRSTKFVNVYAYLEFEEPTTIMQVVKVMEIAEIPYVVVPCNKMFWNVRVSDSWYTTADLKEYTSTFGFLLRTGCDVKNPTLSDRCIVAGYRNAYVKVLHAVASVLRQCHDFHVSR